MSDENPEALEAEAAPKRGKPFDRDACITHIVENNAAFTEPEELADFDDDRLKALRESTKTRRKKRSTPTTHKPRTYKIGNDKEEGGGKVRGYFDVAIDHEASMLLGKAGYRTANSIGELISEFVTSHVETGAGALAFIPEGKRLPDSVKLNINKMLSSALSYIETQAVTVARVNAYKSYLKAQKAKGIGAKFVVMGIVDQATRQVHAKGAEANCTFEDVVNEVVQAAGEVGDYYPSDTQDWAEAAAQDVIDEVEGS